MKFVFLLLAGTALAVTLVPTDTAVESPVTDTGAVAQDATFDASFTLCRIGFTEEDFGWNSLDDYFCGTWLQALSDANLGTRIPNVVTLDATYTPDDDFYTIVKLTDDKAKEIVEGLIYDSACNKELKTIEVCSMEFQACFSETDAVPWYTMIDMCKETCQKVSSCTREVCHDKLVFNSTDTQSCIATIDFYETSDVSTLSVAAAAALLFQ